MEKIKNFAKIIFILILATLLTGIYISLYNLQIKQKNLLDKVTNMYNKESEQISYLAKHNYEDLYNQIARLKNMSVEPYYLDCRGGNCDLMSFDYSKKESKVIFKDIQEEIRKFEGVAAGVSDRGPKLIGISDSGMIIVELSYYDTEWSKSILYEINTDNKTIRKIGELTKK